MLVSVSAANKTSCRCFTLRACGERQGSLQSSGFDQCFTASLWTRITRGFTQIQQPEPSVLFSVSATQTPNLVGVTCCY